MFVRLKVVMNVVAANFRRMCVSGNSWEGQHAVLTWCAGCQVPPCGPVLRPAVALSCSLVAGKGSKAYRAMGMIFCHASQW